MASIFVQTPPQGQRVFGTPEADDINIVSQAGTDVILGFDVRAQEGDDEVSLDGSPEDTTVLAADGNDIISVGTQFGNASINGSVFRGGAGNDILDIIAGLGAADSEFRGQGGSDEFLLSGSYQRVFVSGGAQDDTVEFRTAGDFEDSRANLGGGNDILFDGGNQRDLQGTRVIGEGGDDFIDVSSSVAGLFDLSTPFAAVLNDGALFNLGDGDDTLFGTARGSNSVSGGAGNDVIITFDGFDSVLAGDGNDFVTTGANGDYAQLGRGFDVFAGEGGNDTALGFNENDTLFGDQGEDLLYGQANNDVIAGRSDTRTGFFLNNAGQIVTDLSGNPVVQPFLLDDNNTLVGGQGNDFVVGGNQLTNDPGAIAGDLIYGGDAFGSEVEVLTVDGVRLLTALPGGAIPEALNGIQFDASGNVIVDASGNPVLSASGNDTLVGMLGNDTIFGESGNDDIYGDEAFVRLFDQTGTNLEYTDPLQEAFRATQNDFLQGDSGLDEIWGGAGDDTIFGNAGDDTIVGGSGSDLMTGGAGADTFYQFQSPIDRPQIGHSVDVSQVSQGDNLTITFFNQVGGFDDGPDVITDFKASVNSGAIVDQLGFQGFTGVFRDNTGSATGAFAEGDVVIYSGVYNEVNKVFVTTEANAGPDILAFRAGPVATFPGTPNTPLVINEANFGEQAVVLLGASDESFAAGNFIESGSFNPVQLLPATNPQFSPV